MKYKVSIVILLLLSLGASAFAFWSPKSDKDPHPPPSPTPSQHTTHPTQDVLSSEAAKYIIVTDPSRGVSLDDLEAGSGIAIDDDTTPQSGTSGVISLQGQSGSITLSPGEGIGIEGLQIINTDKGSDQNIFKTITIGQSSISATSNTDGLSFASSSGITIAADPENKLITIGHSLFDMLNPLGLLYAASSQTIGSLAPGTAGYLLQAGIGGLPSWVAPSAFTTTSLAFSAITEGTNLGKSLIIGDGSTFTATGNGVINATHLLGFNWGAPGIIGNQASSSAFFTSLTAGTTRFTGLGAGIAHISSSGAMTSSPVNLTNSDVTGILPLANGGTGTTSFASGDLLYYASGSALSKLGVGSTNTVLTSSGTIPQWANSLSLTGTITANGTIRTNNLFWLSTGTTGTATVLRLENYSNSASATGIGLASKLSGTDNNGTEWQFFNIVKDQTWTGTATTRDAYMVFNTLSDNILKESLRIGSTGNIGINTTNPQEKLHVANGNIRVGGGYLCVRSTDTACAGTTPGTIYASNTTVQAADLAENYVSSQKLEPGDVIMPDGNNEEAVIKTVLPYQSQTIGIVSTKPGVTLNSEAKTNDRYPNIYPIALAGRVPVRISTENGTIAVGDLLTTSSIPGVAMKATKQGSIIGKALQSYTKPDVGKIMIFVTLNTSVDSPETLATNQTTGEGILSKGKTTIEITTTGITEKSKVFITPTTITDSPLAVVAKNTGKSFTIKIAKKASQDIRFDWWIVN